MNNHVTSHGALVTGNSVSTCVTLERPTTDAVVGDDMWHSVYTIH